VTEGDKVEAQLRFGVSVNTYGINDLAAVVDAVEDAAVDAVIAEYLDLYSVAEDLRPGGDRHHSVRYQATLEVALRTFLTDGGFGAFTTNFEDLGTLRQLPGLAVQRLMAEGYGFGAEGDWKTAALLRIFKVISNNSKTSFMEDYTYHLEHGRERILGAHMLEVCPTIASGKPSLEVHPLGIGGKSAPARLIFDTVCGKAINCSLLDMGDEFRLLANPVNTVLPDEKMPELPVANAVWVTEKPFKNAVREWIENGGAHHSVYSQSVNLETIEDFCRMAQIKMILI
jgi:L-arabinose isomerase